MSHLRHKVETVARHEMHAARRVWAFRHARNAIGGGGDQKHLVPSRRSATFADRVHVLHRALDHAGTEGDERRGRAHVHDVLSRGWVEFRLQKAHARGGATGRAEVVEGCVEDAT